MHGAKCFLSVLHIKADCIDDTVGASHAIGHRAFVANIGFRQLNLWVVACEESATPIWIPRHDPNGKNRTDGVDGRRACREIRFPRRRRRYDPSSRPSLKPK